MFLGRFDHSLDDKGRLAIPARFRADLENGLYLTAGLERCLHVLTPQAFQTTADALNALSWLNPGAAELQRNLFGMTVYLTPDKLGRILVPTPLREYAELQSEVAVIGAFSRVELWSLANWDQQRSRFNEHGQERAQQLSDLLRQGGQG